MNVTFRKVKNSLIISPQGEIDHHNCEAIREEIEKQCYTTRAKNIIVDFNDVRFMDSSGIGMMISRYKYTHNRGGRTVVTGIDGNLRRIFTLSGLGRIIPIYSTIDDAINNI